MDVEQAFDAEHHVVGVAMVRAESWGGGKRRESGGGGKCNLKSRRLRELCNVFVDFCLKKREALEQLAVRVKGGEGARGRGEWGAHNGTVEAIENGGLLGVGGQRGGG